MNYFPDTYWNGGLDITLPEFLNLTFPDSASIFDLDRGYETLDKDLLKLFPEAGTNRDKRTVDKLIKLYRKDGKQELVLIHIEVQGYDDPHFALRMFIYFYRLFEKYKLPVTSIVLFTTRYKPNGAGFFHYEQLGTKLTFEYNTIHIFDYTEEQLLAMDNAIGIMLLAAQKAVFKDSIPDSELAGQRLMLAKALLTSNKYSHDNIVQILAFVKNIIHIQDPEINRNFDEQILELTQNQVSMGILELIKEEGIEEGLEKGREEGREEERERSRFQFVRNLITQLNLSDQQAAGVAEVPVGFVQRVRKEIESSKK